MRRATGYDPFDSSSIHMFPLKFLLPQRCQALCNGLCRKLLNIRRAGQKAQMPEYTASPSLAALCWALNGL